MLAKTHKIKLALTIRSPHPVLTWITPYPGLVNHFLKHCARVEGLVLK